MSDFKVDDEVFWLEVDHDTRDDYRRPLQFYICSGVVKSSHRNVCRIYDKCNDYLIDNQILYKSKQECIDAFKKRLDEL